MLVCLECYHPRRMATKELVPIAWMKNMQEKRQQMLKSRLMLHNPSRRRLLLSWTQHRDKSLAHPMLLIYVVAKPYCPDINSYLRLLFYLNYTSDWATSTNRNPTLADP